MWKDTELRAWKNRERNNERRETLWRKEERNTRLCCFLYNDFQKFYMSLTLEWGREFETVIIR
jgi:hypothetical protein